MPTYTVVVTFTADSAELENPVVVADEIHSWLESLTATVHDVEVEERP
jgi:hypothetical protein